jgi:hypothetical protein
VVVGLPLLAAAPASAHTISSVQATNYRSEIVEVQPPVPGLHVRLLDLGRRVELSVAGPDDVVVVGYQGEPYLRVGPAGVFENRRSPTLYLNRTPPGGGKATVPATADATAAPEWHRTSTGHTARWRDQRTRWEGADPPSVAQAAGTAQVVVPTWRLPLRQGDTPVVVVGRILWVPGPSPWPWVVLAAVAAGLCLGLSRRRRWEVPLSAGLAAVVAVSIVRTVGLEAASGRPPASVALTVVATSLVPMVMWGLGAWAVAAVQARQEHGILAAGVVGFFLALLTLGDLPTFTRSQVQTAFSASFSRAALALTLGLGLGVAGAAALAVRALVMEVGHRPRAVPGTSAGGRSKPAAGTARRPPGAPGQARKRS